MNRPFETGAPVLVRNLVQQRVHYVEPAIVVVDAPGERLLYRPCGTPTKVPGSFRLRSDPSVREQVAQHEAATGEWHHFDNQWARTDVLITARPADWFSVWMLWEPPQRTFLCYYVNFEVPWTRTGLGFDTTDLCLDLVVAPDLTLSWKDHAAFEDRVDRGLIAREHAVAVQTAVERVLKRIAERQSPVSGVYAEWVPDASWSTPRIPKGWDRVH
jgi:Protein of unknown function (DUF402)